MSRSISPTVRRRRLSAVLRQLRHQHGKTLEIVTDDLRVPWSLGPHGGEQVGAPDPGNIRQLLDYYEVDDQARRDAVLDLARQSRERGWWTKFKDVFGTDSVGGVRVRSVRGVEPGSPS